MKSFTFLLFIVVAFCTQLCSQTLSKSILFEEKAYDFGEILESKGKVSHTFVFWNHGTTPVVIDNIATGCGCTSFNYTKDPVMPGKMGKIIITYNPLYRPGYFSKEIIMFSNNNANMNRFWIKGTVIPFIHPVEEDYPYDFGAGLHLNLKVLSFGNITNNGTKQINLRYANDTNKSMTLDFIVENNDKNIKFSNPGKLDPLERGQMVVSYTMTNYIKGENVVNIYPVVNGNKSSQPLQAKITGTD